MIIKKKINYDSNEGRINIQFLEKKKTIYLELDKIGCEFLINELTDLLNGEGDFVDYDPSTGYDCGLLTKDSLGLMIVRKDFN